MGRTAVVGVEAVQKGAQHTALWGADAQRAGWRRGEGQVSQSGVGWLKSPLSRHM